MHSYRPVKITNQIILIMILGFLWINSVFGKNIQPVQLTLEEAILLSVRQNPNIESTKLSYTLQKFNAWVQTWEFYPHYQLEANAFAGNDRVNNYWSRSRHFDIRPGVSLNTPIGTQLMLGETNMKSKYYNPGLSFEVKQPLMRGFGKTIVLAALNDARDSELLGRLNVEGVIRSTITNVINAYLDVMTAAQIVNIDQAALTRGEASVAQTKYFIRAGRKAGNELVTVAADVASAKAQLENDKHQLAQSQYALLTEIGIDPNTPVHFSNLQIDQLIKKYHLPKLHETKRLVLTNDIQYQTDQIILHGQLTRGLLIAKDNTRSRLNLTGKIGTGNSVGDGKNSGFNSLLNGVNQSNYVELSLQVPIDNQLEKQAVLNAKIALKKAIIALRQEKWQKETSAINAWYLVSSAATSLRFAVTAASLQKQTYQIGYQKYLHGLIDSLQLQSAQLALIRSQQLLLEARINYIKALVNLDLLIGHTLKTWQIRIKI